MTMRLCKPTDVPRVSLDSVYRQSRFVTVLIALLLIALLAGVPLAIVVLGRGPLWINVPLSLFAALVAIALVRAAGKSFRADNWLLRIASDGLWINLRSYQNREFAPANTVLFVPYDEIVAVRKHSQRRSERIGRNNASWTDRYLDVVLRGPAIPELAAEIAEERRRRHTSKYLGGAIASHKRSNHVPVTVPTDTLIRIAWRGRHDYIVPSLDHALHELAARTPIENATQSDVADVASMSEAALDALILERVEQGDKISAIKLLQENRGYSLTDAEQFVDELVLRI